jgi:PAS domain S-box-containing protein
MLGKAGDFKVTTALSAPEALRLLEKERFDAIISDYQMPGMDGIHFLGEVRKHFGSIPFILFTGRGREEVVIQAINSGADFYVQKGGETKSQFADLIHKVRQAVQRRVVELALRKSEAELRRAEEIGRFGSWELLLDENVVNTSEGARILYGMKKTDLTFEEIQKIPLPEYRPVLDASLRDVISGKSPYNVEFKIRRLSDGSVLTLHSVAEYDPERNAVFGVLHDITERKRVEEELQKQKDDINQMYGQLASVEEELRTQYDESVILHTQTAESQQLLFQVINTVPARVYWKDRNLRFLGCNESFAHDAGLSNPRDLIDKTDFDITLREQALQYNGEDQNVIETGEPTTGIEELRTSPDRNTIWLRKNKVPLRDAAGTIIGILGTYEDITDYKQSVESLRESGENYRRIVETAHEGIWKMDEKFDTVYVNRRLADILGFSQEEMIGKNLASFILAEDIAENNTRLEERRIGKSGRHETRLVTKDGKIKWVQVSATPLLDPDGTFLGSFAMCSDITDRKDAERGIIQRNEELHAAYEQLKAADEQLRQANRQLSLLSGITRHDILNKITGIFGYLKLIEMQSDDPRLGVYLVKIEDAIKEIQSQIEFTRIYQDLGTHEPLWIELEGVMPLAQVPEGVLLRVHVDGVEVYADPMLGKIFFNLLDNSIRHGQRVTEIRVSSQKSGEDLVILWEDNGIGIAADEKERIFEWGFGKNTGLGMFLIREILSLTGITIKETGHPGKGVRFEITVPQGQFQCAKSRARRKTSPLAC